MCVCVCVVCVCVCVRACVRVCIYMCVDEMDATKVWVQVNSCSLVSPKLLKEASESS